MKWMNDGMEMVLVVVEEVIFVWWMRGWEMSKCVINRIMVEEEREVRFVVGLIGWVDEVWELVFGDG